MSIESLLKATQNDFKNLYIAMRADCPEEEFIEEYQKFKARAEQDAATLKAVNVTHRELGKKIARIFLDTNVTFNQMRSTERAVITLVIDTQAYAISEFDMTESGYEDCLFCNHTIESPTSYYIENKATKEAIKVHEITLHMIKKHHCFGENYPVDPLKACRVLGLFKN